MHHALYDDVNLRMKRALQLVDEFEEACAAWERETQISLLYSRDGGWHVWSTLPVKPPPAELAIRAGEIAHHLRASLDIGAGAAVTANGHSPGARVAFPIAMTEQAWRSQGEGQLKGASAAAIKFIKTKQPIFGHGRFGPQAHYLALIAEVDAADKHRQILARGVAVKNYDIGMRWESDKQVMRRFRYVTNREHHVHDDRATWFMKMHVALVDGSDVEDYTGVARLDDDLVVAPEVRFIKHKPYQIEFEKSRLRSWVQYVGGVLYSLEDVVARSIK
ncbi:hypothetical protein [Clavibacter sp. VKM Ac-2872]|uniref:hypothetical protein n=1 Tax=Clavibacter sp. VKM Ac-2872 TaxID=2783812 RepID=UPI00188DC206|nr:hypothetical protein [Clavibacter sp. VKM Ac-2872]MBF4624840.1 hypothetical protein [Clavibacter sp. VKM Ac-2872]